MLFFIATCICQPKQFYYKLWSGILENLTFPTNPLMLCMQKANSAEDNWVICSVFFPEHEIKISLEISLSQLKTYVRILVKQMTLF